MDYKFEELTIDNVEDIVYNWPTQHEMGFTGIEINTLLGNYLIDGEKFYDKLGINTVGVVNGQSVTYHCDILKGLRCVLEDRDQTLEEWD
jgi:hypothetical protein